jgi:hypothetical protein
MLGESGQDDQTRLVRENVFETSLSNDRTLSVVIPVSAPDASSASTVSAHGLAVAHQRIVSNG